MSIVKGIKSTNQKKHLIYEHRMNVYQESIDLLLAGKVTPEYVKERGRKLVNIGRHI